MTKLVVASVNGKDISLREALSLALWREDLGFIEEAIDARIVKEVAGEFGIDISFDELQAAADDFRIARELDEASAMHEWLAARGRTVAQWQDYLEQGLLADRLRDALFDSKIDQYFAENQSDFDRAIISRLILKDEVTAQELWHRIFDDGEDFHSLARKYSCDAATRPSGGLAGPVSRRDLSPAVRAAVFAARAGEVIGPIAVKEGWLLVKVEEHLPAVLNTEIREQIKARLFRDWLAKQREMMRAEKCFQKWV